MSDDPSTIGLQHPAFSVSKTILLDWINGFFGLNYTKVEECATGAIYCQILDAIYPGKVQMKLVKWNAKNEYEFVQNFKIVQKVLNNENISKPVPIDKLVKARYQDNLEYLQWFKHFFECRYSGAEYDAPLRRGAGAGGAPGAAKISTKAAAPVKKAVAAPAPKRAAAGPAALTGPAAKPKAVSAKGDDKEKLLAQIAELEVQMEGFERERDFYFGKLREVEILCQSEETDSFSKEKVMEILYKADEPAEEEAAAPAAADAETF